MCIAVVVVVVVAVVVGLFSSCKSSDSLKNTERVRWLDRESVCVCACACDRVSTVENDRSLEREKKQTPVDESD